MADLKISALTASTTPLAGTEVLPIVQSSTTKQVSVANLTAGRAVSAANLTSATDNSAGYTGLTLDNSSTFATNNKYAQVAFTGRDTVNTTKNGAFFRGKPADDNLVGYGLQVFVRNSDTVAQSAEFTYQGNLSLNTGNLVPSTSGKGIDFSANTGAAGMTSELLNWYEEGTWTPVLSATTTPPTVSYSNRTGRYTRVGRLVTLHMWMNISSQSGGSGDVTITGLPFASANTSGAPVTAVTVGVYQNINPGVGLIMTPYITSSSSVINLAASTQIGSGWGNMTTAALSASNINLQLTVTYIV